MSFKYFGHLLIFSMFYIPNYCMENIEILKDIDMNRESLHLKDQKITTCAFSPDGNFLVMGCQNGSIIVWDTKSSQVHCILKNHSIDIRTLFVNQSSNLVAAICKGGDMCLSDLQKKGKLCGFRDDKPFFGGSFDGNDALCMIFHDEVACYNIEPFRSKAKVALEERFPDSVEIMDYKHPNIIVRHNDQKLVVINITKGDKNETTVDLVGHTAIVKNAQLSNDNKKLVSCSNDKTIRTWNLATGTETKTLCIHDIPEMVSFDGNDTLIIAVEDHAIHIWDVLSGQKLYQFNSAESIIKGIVNANNKLAVVLTTSGKVVLYPLKKITLFSATDSVIKRGQDARFYFSKQTQQ